MKNIILIKNGGVMRSNKMIKMQGFAAFKSQYWLSVLTYVIAAAAISVLSGSFNVEFKPIC